MNLKLLVASIRRSGINGNRTGISETCQIRRNELSLLFVEVELMETGDGTL